ncbi:TIGR02221 family CRISPR-associated protein [Thiolapillus sp.]
MTRTLISFLGRTPKGQSGYRTTRYDFGDDSDCEALAFFGWALQKRLRPQRLVILGTAGSMWDHLLEHDLQLGNKSEESRLVLMESVEKQQVSQKQLNALAPLLAEHLGCEVHLSLIPYCGTEEEQSDLLKEMARHIGIGDEVHIDITHGFRHLPMLALLAALYLKQVRQAEITGIWYAAFDPDTARAPVHKLEGLLHFSEWLNALATYEHSGDYSVFAPLIGGDIGYLLEEAAFLEGINRIGQARSRLRKVIKELDRTPPTDPALRLFSDELHRRISWAEGDNYYLRQRSLAHELLHRKRYRDAILTGLEAFITLLLHEHKREYGQGHDPDDYKAREDAKNAFEEREKSVKPHSERYRAYKTLRHLRNAVAHGSRPQDGEVLHAMESPNAMSKTLDNLFRKLLPENT